MRYIEVSTLEREKMAREAHGKLSSPENLVIQRKVEGYLENKSDPNVIVDLIQALMSKDEAVIFSAINGLQTVFNEVISDGNACPNQKTLDIEDEEKSLEDKLVAWHTERFLEAIEELFLLFTKHKSKIVQENSFCTLITLSLTLNDKHPENNKFTNDILKKIIEKLLDDESNTNYLINKYSSFKDKSSLNLITLKTVLSILRERQKSNSEDNTVFLENTFSLLHLFCAILEENKGNLLKKRFSATWIEFLKFRLSPSLYKKVLINLHSKILPNLTNPLLLTDFLTDSYNIGGVVSLLALNGLFFLIQKYNLEYPEFYNKLYALLTDVIFYAKYRARFFYLTDLFLSSTHIPAYLVAAFAKRLARLALIAPPDVLLTIIPFIGNLLVRHPSLIVLIDRPNVPDVNEDPYIADERDPSLCKAIDSSLWEIKSLQNHWHPEVSKKALFINKLLPQMEWDLSDILEIRHKDLFEKEIGQIEELEDIPLCYHKALGLFNKNQDTMSDMWTL